MRVAQRDRLRSVIIGVLVGGLLATVIFGAIGRARPWQVAVVVLALAVGFGIYLWFRRPIAERIARSALGSAIVVGASPAYAVKLDIEGLSARIVAVPSTVLAVALLVLSAWALWISHLSHTAGATGAVAAGRPPEEQPARVEPVDSIYNLLRESGDFPLFKRWRELEQLVTDRFRDFIGREQILAEVDRRLGVLERSPHRGGTLLLRGEPGLGKTSLAAALAMRGYLHHFNSTNLGITSRAALLQNLCTQVILRFGLDRTRTPANAEDGFSVLTALLAEASKKSPQRIVIVIDALDEMERKPPLGLPERLPEKVFVVITSRSKVEALQGLVFAEPPIDLDKETQNNLRDLRAYIEREISKQPFLAERLHRLGGVEGLLARSEGNFMYVVQVLRHVGGPDFESLKELPSSLISYYEQHWDRMVGVPGFNAVHTKLLEQLATAGGPVTVTDLSVILGLERALIADALRSWAEFLHIDTPPTGERYSLYHATFREFLATRLDLNAVDRAWHADMRDRFAAP